MGVVGDGVVGCVHNNALDVQARCAPDVSVIAGRVRTDDHGGARLSHQMDDGHAQFGYKYVDADLCEQKC
jgi:hypothetical protein